MKRFIEKGLRGAGVAVAIRAARRSDVLVLTYHNIIPNGMSATGDLSLHLPQREFARQLDWLSSTHNIVPLATIFDTPRSTARPRAVITFDDAYRGALTAGADELARRDLPATIFIAPSFVGSNGLWWDMLAPEGVFGLCDDIRTYCLEALDGRNDRVLAWAAERSIPLSSVPPHQGVATEDELLTCTADGRITFASHTWSHPNLRRIGVPELSEELERPLRWLRARFRNVVPWLAYPYGLATRATAAATRASGYEGAFLVRGGRASKQDLSGRRYTLPRMNIPAALSLDAFVLRASGLLGRDLRPKTT